MATLKKGKPYIYVTWLAKLLGGDECAWSAWFRSRYSYTKYEEQALDLVKWNREHTELMRTRRLELEREGFTVSVEEANAFKLEGDVAILAGKPDIVATKPGLALVVDGKTGKMRESDTWQVLLYLFALPKLRPELATAEITLEGEVQYGKTDDRIAIASSELTPQRLDQIVRLIKVIAGQAEPPRVPSRGECLRCNIGFADCPERVGRAQARDTVTVGEF